LRNETKYKLLKGKCRGERGPRRISWLKNHKTCFSKTTTELFRAAVNIVIIARMIDNI
jgi:hypothetical protein